MPLFHEWLSSPSFAFYRPNLRVLCPTAFDLQQRLATLAEFVPPVELEVLVMHRASGMPLGAMALSAIDPINGKAEFSLGFVRGQGTRCAMEALHFALDHAFRAMALRKLIFYVLPDNRRALDLLHRSAIALEGRLRGELLLPDRVADLLRFGLLREEWESGPLRARLQKLVPLVTS